ncbi:MAG: sterol desaturase family protein [Acidobacteriia bacterium]|nr:sterol desaturase family protein [Methyloceanibacter sp.]MBX5472184.1 sterol desaturase family protein [Acetobacteraceae bacterium]MCL6492309.1 sterol desaturase family protein [Terriglobia bacterium]
MSDPFDTVAGWVQEHLLLPLLYHLGLMAWEEVAYGWALFATYGAAQVALMYAICVPLERWRPVERWNDQRAVLTDVLYTIIARVGLLPLVSFVAFYRVQVALNGWLTDHGYVPPTLERFIPALLGHPAVTFLCYALLLDLADYWRHRLSHRFSWWWALHSLHHAQRQMTFWSDDRNHILDDLISALWFGAIALLIGVPPMQFPLLILLLRLLESISHANVRLDFGWLGERLLISPRFHRAHHGVLAAGERSCNYGAVFPFWDMLFGTADFSKSYPATGDPSAEEVLATGSYLAQQWAGLRRFMRSLRRIPEPQ